VAGKRHDGACLRVRWCCGGNECEAPPRWQGTVVPSATAAGDKTLRRAPFAFAAPLSISGSGAFFLTPTVAPSGLRERFAPVHCSRTASRSRALARAHRAAHRGSECSTLGLAERRTQPCAQRPALQHADGTAYADRLVCVSAARAGLASTRVALSQTRSGCGSAAKTSHPRRAPRRVPAQPLPRLAPLTARIAAGAVAGT
jgi:hypothetical protein